MVASPLKGYFMSTLDFLWKPLAEATRITANSNLHHKRFCRCWRWRWWWWGRGLQNSSKYHWKCATCMDPVVAFGKWWLFLAFSHFMEYQRTIYCHLSLFIKKDEIQLLPLLDAEVAAELFSCWRTCAKSFSTTVSKVKGDSSFQKWFKSNWFIWHYDNDPKT